MKLGDRVWVPSQACSGTVRWLGRLPGLNSDRVGVELDVACDGHSGEYLGVQYFEAEDGMGKFFKNGGIVLGVDFHLALTRKYKGGRDDGRVSGTESSQQSSEQSSGPPLTKPSHSTPVLVGAEKANQHFEKLEQLTEICLDGLGVSSCMHIGMSGLKRVSLMGNLIADLEFAVQLTRQLPRLEDLDLSGNRLSTIFDTAPHTKHSCLLRLGLNETGLAWDSGLVGFLASAFPQLEELGFAKNSLRGVCGARPIRPLAALRQLSWASCGLVDWKTLFETVAVSCPQIATLDVSGNALGDLSAPIGLTELRQLNLADTGIASWESIKFLKSGNFENLRFLTSLASPASPAFYTYSARPLIIALFPRLRVLNGATVSAAQRTDAGKYCHHLLERGDAVTRSLFSDGEVACLKSQFGSISSTSGVSVPTATSNLCILAVKGGQKEAQLRLPRTLQIRDLAGLVAKKISWPLKLSEMVLQASPQGGGLEDIQSLDDCEGRDLGDLGIETGWVIFASVREIN